ncbi:MAG: haloacid dehalogenase-like hydrolase [Hyphomicrobium sp.]|nr:haloacid dehalogenase-like hydrolase [Hyphomicrobium sp.]
MTATLRVVFGVVVLLFAQTAVAASDPLSSWNDGPAKKAILEFVAAVTDENGKDYVPAEERIAVFDNDGTLWVEYPMYTQVLFALDRVKKLAPQHPEWKTKQPFKALLEGDMKTVGASGMKGLMKLIMASHGGMSGDEFEQEVAKWLVTAKHPHLDCL